MEINTLENQIPLKKYYVYLLIDPRNKEVFYVGKGQGERALQHVRVAKNDSEGHKNNRILEIQASGNDVKELVIGRYDSEEEAYAVESTLIKWGYGFENLTNSVHGHYSQSIRKKDFHDIVDGIDIPIKLYNQAGEYTEAFRKLVEENQVAHAVEDMRLKFIERLGLEFTEVDLSNPRFINFSWHYGDICLRIARPPTKEAFSITLNSFIPSKKNKQIVNEISAKTDFESKKDGEYARHIPDINSADPQVLIDRFLMLKSILENTYQP